MVASCGKCSRWQLRSLPSKFPGTRNRGTVKTLGFPLRLPIIEAGGNSSTTPRRYKPPGRLWRQPALRVSPVTGDFGERLSLMVDADYLLCPQRVPAASQHRSWSDGCHTVGLKETRMLFSIRASTFCRYHHTLERRLKMFVNDSCDYIKAAS